MNYSKAIKIIRASKGISQQEFSEKTGLSPSLVSRIESNDRKLSDKNIKVISKKMSIPSSLIKLLAYETGDTKSLKTEDTTKIGQMLIDLVM